MAADDDDEMTPEDPGTETEEDEAGETDLDAEPDVEELDEDEDATFGLEDDDDAVVVADEVEEEDEEDSDADDAPTTRTKRRTPAAAGDEEEDEDEEMLSPDDVEADLDRILKDRLVTVEDDDEDEDEEPDERGDPGDRLQPKRADEQLCSNCFLLVRANAPGCPVGDDDCPIFG